MKESSDRFANLCAALPDATISEWTADETMMQELRAVEVDVMDDYDVREERCTFLPTYPYPLTYACLSF